MRAVALALLLAGLWGAPGCSTSERRSDDLGVDLASASAGDLDLAVASDMTVANGGDLATTSKDLAGAPVDLAQTSSVDLRTADAGATNAPTLGAATLAQHINATGTATGTLTTSAVTTVAGSLLLASAARGSWSAAPDAPTDSAGDAYSIVGSTHTYASWPSSATGLYRATAATGGAGQTFSLTWGDIGSTGDEITLSVVEVRGATTIDAHSWVERATASSVTSATVTTTGPALLVAWWWGSGGVRPVNDLHVAVPGDGFSIVPGATGLKSLSSNGYIQVAVAQKTVTAAGTYSITWTTDDEGAQLYLVALR